MRIWFLVASFWVGSAPGPYVALVPGIARPVHNVGVLNLDVEGLDLKKKA